MIVVRHIFYLEFSKVLDAIPEGSMQRVFQNPEWKNAYSTFVPFVRSEGREAFRVVE